MVLFRVGKNSIDERIQTFEYLNIKPIFFQLQKEPKIAQFSIFVTNFNHKKQNRVTKNTLYPAPCTLHPIPYTLYSNNAWSCFIPVFEYIPIFKFEFSLPTLVLLAEVKSKVSEVQRFSWSFDRRAAGTKLQNWVKFAPVLGCVTFKIGDLYHFVLKQKKAKIFKNLGSDAA